MAIQHLGRNVVHGSDSPENGKREIGKAFSVSGYFVVMEKNCWGAHT